MEHFFHYPVLLRFCFLREKSTFVTFYGVYFILRIPCLLIIRNDMTVKNSLLLPVLAVTGILSAFPQDVRIEFEEYDLPNGLHIILNPGHSTPMVAETLMCHAGSKNEDPEKTGVADFFEMTTNPGQQTLVMKVQEVYNRSGIDRGIFTID